MDVEKSLRELKAEADSGPLKEIVFTSDMENAVKERLRNRRRQSIRIRLLASAAVVVSAAAMFVLSPWMPAYWRTNHQEAAHSVAVEEQELHLPGTVWNPPSLWKPSPRHQETYMQDSVSYIGEKPVRIIAGDLYENQADKVMWLLNGLHANKVELVGIHENGQRYYLGDWETAGPLYDADRHFPSAIMLPEPGIWKLQVLADDVHFGQVFVEVKPGISPSNRSLAEPLIQTYVETNQAFAASEKDVEVTIELLGIKKYDADQFQVYAWITVHSGDPASSAGIRAPVKFEIHYVGQSYRVLGHTMPEPGAAYWAQVEQIFPAKIAELLKKRAVQSNL
ncbi:hypothetical protein [Brevibacillus migulae]|uniref:hypothetical protein n=1 Tax=Brevibacillus migulae TaxID=1644114 RepID=UPI00106EAB89|nr:hypothetical protein [Brevibacillus migulae]